MERVKYLFNITFENIQNIILEYQESIESNKHLEIEEREKIEQLKNNPYGKWKVFLNKIKV